MRKSIAITAACAFLLSASSCNFLGDILGSNHTGYEDYLIEELEYKKAESIGDLNKAIAEKAYRWRKEEYDASRQSTYYYTGKGLMVCVYDSGRITVNTLDGRGVFIENNEKAGSIALDPDAQIYVDVTNHKWYTSDKTKEKGINEEDEDAINVAADEDGYLVSIDRKELIYVDKDFKNFYVNENNTDEFVGYSSKKKVPSSDLLTSVLESLGKDARMAFPDPGVSCEIWHGEEYYQGKYSHYAFYLGGVDPLDYAKKLEANGFTVSRKVEDLIFLPFYGDRAGIWTITDAKEELKVSMTFRDYLYINNAGQNFGPEMNCCFSVYRSPSYGYAEGKGVTENKDWTSFEKTVMQQEWYEGNLNVVIPFIPLEKSYRVASSLSKYSEDLFGGAMSLDQKCYRIYDMSVHYRLDGYDKVLEAAGYHHYEPEYDLSDAKQRTAYKQTDESKYYDCYINKELNCAIKYSFSFNYGNCIKVFKLDEMKSSLVDPK